MIYQPLIHEGSESIIYVGVSFSEIQGENIIRIVVTDVYSFSKEFKIKSNLELSESTFQLNLLTLDDLNIANTILDKLLSLSELFKPVIQESKIIELNHDFSVITFINDGFKYKFPLTIMSESDELNTIKELYSNLEKYSQYQTSFSNRLTTLVKTKDKIIKTLSFAYYEKVNPITEKPESLNEMLKRGHLNKIFIRKEIFNYFQTDVIKESRKNTTQALRKDIIVDPERSMIWNRINQNEQQESSKEEEKEFIHIEEFGNVKEEEESTTPVSSQPKVKRKLQGLLRRQQKMNKSQ